MGRKVGGAGVEAERVVGELAGDEAALLGAADHHGEVGLAAREREAARGRDELDGEVRVAVGEPGEARSEEADAEAVGGADADDAGGGGLGALQPRLDAEHLGLDALQRLEERCAGVGQLAAVGAADEELGAERGLERRHPAARASPG